MKCQYIGNEETGVDSEVEKGGVIKCEAEAEVGVRIADSMNPMKRNVCREHAQWLQSDECERNWEQIALQDSGGKTR